MLPVADFAGQVLAVSAAGCSDEIEDLHRGLLVGEMPSKGAVLALTRSLAKEWGRYGVRVNCVAFGLIDTRLTQAADSPVSIDVMGREMKAG